MSWFKSLLKLPAGREGARRDESGLDNFPCGTLSTVISPMAVHVEGTDAERITARITTPSGVETRVTTESNYSLDHSATPWLPPLLTAGMRKGWDITFDGPVDSTALRGASGAQKVFLDWYPKRFREVSISAEPGRVATGATGVGCFFSGGVDSFYSAITESDRITHLIFVHGFDIDVDDENLAARASAAARKSAAELGKPLIEVKTTMRSAFGDRLPLDWGYDFHGAALAHVGLALSQHLSTVIIPSSNCREELTPWGSHPDLDPLWSSGTVEFEHHELELHRLGKIRRIGENRTAMNHLRVCWENLDGAFNCGRCAKCVRTRIGLAAAGAQCTTFPEIIDVRAVRRMDLRSRDDGYLRTALAAMQASGISDAELTQAVNQAIRRSYWTPALFFMRSAGSRVGQVIRRSLRR
ncbi:MULTISPECIES: hypothetical protein [unclassified Rhodococcus (in: high G+C Gram-positive bacteria)]|uniref:hypothetical protein n=1 Tax=unclassified Rhodococcus (in: high G+C Gram-positive bacteria) TaxID=192944 RepID=UPI0020CE8350|nr:MULTISPECIES: hypothetical protein [unclassified Rhodococcus (in: high G+C Gram-positive bacteria)]